MSNRDGKHRKTRWIKGRLCPKCKKGKLEKAPCAKVGSYGHEHHVICKTCNSENF